ncbi:MAG: 2-phosphosulfolactate phosphatase [Halanaerobium sp. 4-GBenrich]|jgi:2-phosphosulfolactate phosphatase|uniref:Probable 2-phosphosulfolactate phosphatase n=1 Tax=Halanaerobium congolense TaxID=54121 RepID=A0A1G6TAB5_9FIRM|nr:2-phosphosulfolactate phosphatase [Halanaerobium congolense]ODS50473.1 MAG: 2-phosphosulfolactate phosphatase [Halanaerobium sp. 4-GBenrich]TDS27744.1 2-phosphosulfolactate phosphatase [Halanaerobium congolense]SDD25265.1 2-phosphosulfolactate phosphatase [Halanaerobium congolense]
MKIKNFKFLEGAAKAEGLTVIIDVFRAYTTAAYLFANQAEKIFIVSKVETARKLKKELNNPVLIGERKGIKIEDFDFNNSPYFISQHNFMGKEIILSTSAGTKGIIAAENAAEVITGSFVNIAAAAEYIKSKNPETVSLVAMGNNGVTDADEDNLYADQLANLLKGKKTLAQAEIKARLRSPAGDRFFADETQSEMPKQDFEYCLKLNKFNFVIRAEQIDSDIYQLIRKEVD